MNIAKELKLNADKPAVLSVQKSDTFNTFAIGLSKNQLLEKHKTTVSAWLVVVKGSVLFRIHDEEHHLTELETFSIPVEVVHEVLGLDDVNIFLLTKNVK